jgi:hypothetical protein
MANTQIPVVYGILQAMVGFIDSFYKSKLMLKLKEQLPLSLHLLGDLSLSSLLPLPVFDSAADSVGAQAQLTLLRPLLPRQM